MEGREGLEGQKDSPEASRRDPDLVVQSAGEENQMKQLQETSLTEKGKSFAEEREASTSTEDRLVVKRQMSKHNPQRRGRNCNRQYKPSDEETEKIFGQSHP